MGTSMAFYHIQNRDFDRECLKAGLSNFAKSREAVPSFEELLKSAIGEEAFQQLMEESQKTQSVFDGIFGQRPRLPSPMVAYRPDALWLPFFDENICEGYGASSRDARRLSEAFDAPVLAISIFDSDILFVSYSDAAKKIAYDYAKPNIEGMEEYDTDLFQTEFPQFLVDLCPNSSEEKLREIWNGDEVFADDRMYKLGEVLGLAPINVKVPEGFEVVAES